MKIYITKADGHYAVKDAVGHVHLIGPIDTTACTLALEDYVFKATSKPVTCPQCLQVQEWAKKVAKLK